MTNNLDQLKQESKHLEEDQRYIHDKLIALTTAILGFSIIMIGDGKLSQVNQCILKISWAFFIFYLVFTLATLWASLRYKAVIMSRNALISVDEQELKNETNSIQKNEKLLLLQILKTQEFFLQGFKKHKKDAYFIKMKSLYEKYKNNLKTTKFLKAEHNKFDYLSIRDKIMLFCVTKAEWSYIFFGLGMVALLLSVLLQSNLRAGLGATCKTPS